MDRVIDQILEDDKARPVKQRHSAKRIFERLRDKYAFPGGYTIVKDYVWQRKFSQREMFVPLADPRGHAQADFGEAVVVIAGVEQKAHYFCMDLPQSDDCFVIAFPGETTEAFLEGHTQAFAYFGAVPQTILYDNTKLAVAQILGDGTRQRTRAFSELQSHYLFAERFGRPGKGNDKGKVEGLVGYARRNFLVPVPRCCNCQELNAQLIEQCRKRRERRLRGHEQTIGERFAKDREVLLPLPPVPYEACEKRDVHPVFRPKWNTNSDEERRRNLSALMIASAGAAYLNGGLEIWEFAFCALLTFLAYWGLQDYRVIGAAWLLHTGWDTVHYFYGNPIVPFAPFSSAGCAICDVVLATWYFFGALSIYGLRRAPKTIGSST